MHQAGVRGRQAMVKMGVVSEERQREKNWPFCPKAGEIKVSLDAQSTNGHFNKELQVNEN